MSAESGITGLSHVTVYVEDTDEALDWYTNTLGFVKRADEKFTGGRWLTVAPTTDSSIEVVLMEPDEPDGVDRIGGGTMWVVTTNDCQSTYETLEERGVSFLSPPEEMPWGVSAVFTDLYGNPYNLLEPQYEGGNPDAE